MGNNKLQRKELEKKELEKKEKEKETDNTKNISDKNLQKSNVKEKVFKIFNKGTGAGGSNTNKNGLPYEELTDLTDKITIIEEIKIKKEKLKNSFIMYFNNNDNELENQKSFIKTKKSELFKCMKDETDLKINKAHGCKEPDECYIDKEYKNIFIIEKKFQQGSGSVCEKIQSSDFKEWQYSRTFPEYKIIYIYCLSEWFKKNCIAELEYLNEKKFKYYWGNSETYKDDIIKFILNYK